jgi:hypothetical protein
MKRLVEVRVLIVASELWEPNPRRAKGDRKVDAKGPNHETTIERRFTGKSAILGYPYRRDTELVCTGGLD